METHDCDRLARMNAAVEAVLETLVSLIYRLLFPLQNL